MALLLKSKGYKDVSPLLGGFDAWHDLGYPTEPFQAVEPPLAEVPPAAESVLEKQDNSWA